MWLRLFGTLALLLAGLPAQAASIKGVVLANELSGPPLENVGVDAAAGTSHTETDLAGKFSLEFPRRQPGDWVRLLASKPGYEVVNEVELEATLPADAEAKPLIVLLCKEGNREEMARRFYRLKSFDAIEETYRKRAKELEDMRQATDATLTKLQQERDQAKAAAEKAAEELAKNQPGQSSQLYRQAMQLFLDRKIDEALQLLNDEELRQSVVQAKKAIEQQQKAIEDAVQAWLLKAKLLALQFRFEEAEKACLQAIDAKPDSFEASFAYGHFNQELNRFEKAKVAYSRCLEWARKSGNEDELAKTLNNLGILDSKQNFRDEARKEYQEALQTYRRLAQQNPEAYLPYVAMALNNLGVLDHDQHRPDEARNEHQEALKIRRQLAQTNPEAHLPDVAMTLSNLGNLDSGQRGAADLPQAGSAKPRSLPVRRRHDAQQPGHPGSRSTPPG